MAKILDGKAVSQERKKILKEKIAKLKEEKGITPGIAIINVGKNPASEIYVRNKIKTCDELGIHAVEIRFEGIEKEEEIIASIEKFNQDSSIDGIIVQSPLPEKYNEEKIVSYINPKKDVDGFGIVNLGCLAINQEQLVAATPLGIIHLLEHYKIEIARKHVVIIGRSKIVGRPLSLLFLNRDATVTITHSKTKDLKKITSQADILVSAVGKPKFVTENMVKENAVCIDVGISRVNNHVIGDMDFENIQSKVSYITPVPGGVGPMTIITLLENVYENAVKRKEE